MDKPPLALWVQALSARAFGFNSWSILVPQALLGDATVGLVYNQARSRFGANRNTAEPSGQFEQRFRSPTVRSLECIPVALIGIPPPSDRIGW